MEMTTTTDVQSTTNSTNTSTSKTSANSAQSTEDRFLKLLVAQMQNQDPLNPLDNAQVTSQMAQLSTVTGIEKLNTTLGAMSQSFISSQSMQAATMIGHSVLAQGSDLNLKDGAASSAGVDLQGAADKLVVDIKNSAGKVVRSIDLDAQKSAGTVPFQWDGKTDDGLVAPDGTYTFSVTATQESEKVTANPLTQAKVLSVNLGASGISLNLEGLGAVDAANVKQIF
jgi:flagellar basal-body rod modification protein FlgD